MITMPPYYCRRAWLRSFWLVASCSVGLACGALLVAIGQRHGVPTGAAVALALAVPGLVWPLATSKAFRAWNRLAGRFAAVARLYLTRVCLYTIVPAVGLLGSSMTMERPASVESGWMRRRFPRSLAYGSTADLDTAASPASGQAGWLQAYSSWARRSDNWWTFGLIPFLVLLTAFEEDAPEDPLDHDIYTLY